MTTNKKLTQLYNIKSTILLYICALSLGLMKFVFCDNYHERIKSQFKFKDLFLYAGRLEIITNTEFKCNMSVGTERYDVIDSL